MHKERVEMASGTTERHAAPCARDARCTVYTYTCANGKVKTAEVRKARGGTEFSGNGNENASTDG